MMHKLSMGCAVAGVTVALLAAVAPSASAAQPSSGCGNGFTLVANQDYEDLIAAATHGNVNGDGYICLNDFANPQGQVVIIDNTVPVR